MAPKALHMSAAIRGKLKQARLARLATLDARHNPHIVPICFVFDGSVFYTAVDRKPKRVAAQKLARLRNLRASSQVALVVDDYKEDWTRLWYILVRGTGRQLPVSARQEHQRAIRLLRNKYSQYAGGMLPDDAPVIRVTPQRIVSWGKI